ncbi:chromate transporter [Ramicandelaber brevisporus]|nr:chromate transporter [Ramicandelaber brevisporus]
MNDNSGAAPTQQQQQQQASGHEDDITLELLESKNSSTVQTGATTETVQTTADEEHAIDSEAHNSITHEQNVMAVNAPQWSPMRIFLFFFFKFGIHAFGGPFAQIAHLKDELVLHRKWITIEHFHRVFALYQILPGPEAAELCMFFGCLAGGRLGGLAAGLGFALPGFALMLLFSYLYSIIGLSNVHVGASFLALQPIVAAMVMRAVFKIGEHAFGGHGSETNSNSSDDGAKSAGNHRWLYAIAILTTFSTALRINYFISLAVFSIVYVLVTKNWKRLAIVVVIVQYAAIFTYIGIKGLPGQSSLALGIAPSAGPGYVLAMNLVAGLLSFGGAYTALPLIQAESVYLGNWLSSSVFLDGIGITNILPAPMVIFTTFVGFQGGLGYGEQHGSRYGYAFLDAILATIGILFPCFLFTIIGHDILARVAKIKAVVAVFDGVTAAVVGVVATTALDLLRAAVENQPAAFAKLHGKESSNGYSAVAAVVYVLTLAILFTAKFPHMHSIIVILGAIGGQFMFVA